MRDHNYSNTPSDFWDVWNLLSDLSYKQFDTWGWDFCRFEFWYYRIHAIKHNTDPDFFERNLHLWRDKFNQLRGIFLSEYGQKDIHVIVHPDYLDLEDQIFHWIENKWVKDQSHLETTVPRHNTKRQHLLASYGYAFHGEDGYKYRYDLKTVNVDYTLESGFEIQALRKDTDQAKKILLVRNAFSNNRFTRDHYDSTMKAPSYTPSLDLSIVSPMGKYVAYCMGWINQKTNEGCIEPVGAHADYRRRGFATALVKECFRRMKSLSVQYVTIGGNSQFYDSLKPMHSIPEDRWLKKRLA
jgi:ribosomal protein S18 acetylase RimI-like enzyme